MLGFKQPWSAWERFDRRAGHLAIAGIWFEPGFEPVEESHFVAALVTALQAYRAFIGADAVSWPRTRQGRALARALERQDAAA